MPCRARLARYEKTRAENPRRDASAVKVEEASRLTDQFGEHRPFLYQRLMVTGRNDPETKGKRCSQDFARDDQTTA